MQKQWFNINEEDLSVYQSDDEYAGWKVKVEDYFGYPTYFDQSTGLAKQGCYASRIVYASGAYLDSIEAESP